MPGLINLKGLSIYGNQFDDQNEICRQLSCKCPLLERLNTGENPCNPVKEDDDRRGNSTNKGAYELYRALYKISLPNLTEVDNKALTVSTNTIEMIKEMKASGNHDEKQMIAMIAARRAEEKKKAEFTAAAAITKAAPEEPKKVKVKEEKKAKTKSKKAAAATPQAMGAKPAKKAPDYPEA